MQQNPINSRENLSEPKTPLVVKLYPILIVIVAIAAVFQISRDAQLTKSTPTVTPTPTPTTVVTSSPVQPAPTFDAQAIRNELNKNSWIKDVSVWDSGSVYIGVDRYEKRWDSAMIQRYVCSTIARNSNQPFTVVRFIDANQFVITEDLWKSEITKFNCTN